jgi:hypothetical protein
VNAPALLREFDAAGVRLSLKGEDLRVQTRPGVSIEPFRERIITNKPALLAALTLLDTEIVADEATRRSPEHVARCLAGITARIEAGVNLPADWLALRYWEAIRDEQKRRFLR